jgi:hypothetical protein
VFYESDCQGQGSSLLIVFPWQSAPSDLKTTIESAFGVAEQSFALDSWSMFSVDTVETIASVSAITRGVDHGSI